MTSPWISRHSRSRHTIAVSSRGCSTETVNYRQELTRVFLLTSIKLIWGWFSPQHDKMMYRARHNSFEALLEWPLANEYSAIWIYHRTSTKKDQYISLVVLRIQSLFEDDRCRAPVQTSSLLCAACRALLDNLPWCSSTWLTIVNTCWFRDASVRRRCLTNCALRKSIRSLHAVDPVGSSVDPS